MKREMKKLVSLMLMLTMLLSMVGCSASPEETPQIMAGQDAEVSDEGTKEVADESSDVKQEESQTSGNVLKEDEGLVSDYFVSKLELMEYLVNLYYMNEADEEAMRNGAYKGLMEGLGDPYSCYYTAEEYADLMESTSGTYCGIGAVVQQNVKTMLITIVKPYVNGPAYNAGMLPGDIIYKVDDVDVSGMEIDKVVAMMKGEPNTVVRVTVVRDGVSDPVELTITRAQIEIVTIEHEMLENQIGLITISSFDEKTPKQFENAITSLQAEGMKGLIIDLRDNGGGLLDSVVQMLDYVLPKGMIVYTEDKNGQRQEFKGTDENVVKLPMAVIINGNSASASEIFAAAMQDYKAASIVGTTSFGKGIVQSIIPFSDGTAIKVTVSRYFTPRGVCIHGTGVVPDYKVELKDELKQKVVIDHAEDNQLQVAIKVLETKMK